MNRLELNSDVTSLLVMALQEGEQAELPERQMLPSQFVEDFEQHSEPMLPLITQLSPRIRLVPRIDWTTQLGCYLLIQNDVTEEYDTVQHMRSGKRERVTA